ncbi:hypothetical protein QVD17_12378 [Tagetes erecta]|uniref:Uncharacterized protein n=1 Tax=Tagetes erecta TaxID=13708 RepID=A0AAD8KWL0_TARER|nr:hypothetical protein QVD17_12378 [Tagetes erecta]
MPEFITNTLPENFNPLDHSPENKEKVKEFKRNNSDFGSSKEKDDGNCMTEIVKDELMLVEHDDQINEKSIPVLEQVVDYEERRNSLLLLFNNVKVQRMMLLLLPNRKKQRINQSI